MPPYLLGVVLILIGRFALEFIADLLNVLNIKSDVPAEFADIYDDKRYRRSQEYLVVNTRFNKVEDAFKTVVTLGVILGGGFAWLDNVIRERGQGPVITGLLFTAVIVLAARLLQLPFIIYDTFVIERRFGFNRTKPRTFIADLLKWLLLMAIIGAPVYALVLWFFEKWGPGAWLPVWLSLTAIQVAIFVLSPYVILPLFNRYVPLAAGDLRSAIEDYARRERFSMRGVFTMDGSRRSSKTNAFFTGFGRSRRIVLFDTLIDRHPVAELVAIVAHEMGHYKLHHVPLALARGILSCGITLFLFSRVLGNADFAAAFGVTAPSTHTAIVFFAFLFTPIAFGIGLADHAFTRRHEYQADRYAARTTGSPDGLIAALKRLSVDNLANLTPHPLKVIVDYSHPPLLDRIAELRRQGAQPGSAAPR